MTNVWNGYRLRPVTTDDTILFHEIGMIILSEELTAEEVVSMNLIESTQIEEIIGGYGEHLSYLVILLTEDRLMIARYNLTANQVIHWLPNHPIMRLHYDMFARAFPLYELLHTHLCPNVKMCHIHNMEMLLWIDSEREKHRQALEHLDKLKQLCHNVFL